MECVKVGSHNIQKDLPQFTIVDDLKILEVKTRNLTPKQRAEKEKLQLERRDHVDDVAHTVCNPPHHVVGYPEEDKGCPIDEELFRPFLAQSYGKHDQSEECVVRPDMNHLIDGDEIEDDPEKNIPAPPVAGTTNVLDN